MPELNLGVLQGDALPIYLAIHSITGALVPQPVNNPTIEIVYIESGTHIRKIALPVTVMSPIEPGRYFYVWRVPRNEPTVLHSIMLRAVLDDEMETAPDQSYIITDLVRNQDFEISAQILKRTDVCFPEVMAEGPKCSGRRCLPLAHRNEADIGLNDYALDGVFRFGDYPNQVVDRRVAGRFDIRIGVQGRAMSPWTIPSTTPGGGPAQRLGDPNTSNSSYRHRYRYK